MLSERLNLSGKTAVVTGSSQGIGKAIAIALAEYGANVIIHYRRDKKEAQQVAKQINQPKDKVQIVKADFSKPDGPQKFFQSVSKITDTVDILVINASVQVAKNWQEVTESEFDFQVNANFKSTLLLMQQFAPAMIKKGWGRILTIGSVQQVRPHPAMIVYAATKSAVFNLVKNVALQLADKGVTVNNLAPGIIDTPRIQAPVPKMEKRIAERMTTPEGGMGQPEDCAGMAVFLCSDAGRYITGQNLFVDGGMSL
ncbi:SDR family oxidoreductase [Runella sp. CRIBMP]|uniref:SDR family NAD(P)-dependent oxidoreductase n=1 Tax=Runella sp. CRIBMP TaxID=2683261 RepID=UPI00197E3A4E|nr:SDR family oxidoreductase [Runella sp. CRIBMP]NBB23126.1 SDR family oxidoreductase [Runella sp. CRIBMP]